ncbi:hypothetical protein BH23PLA1_BH23PLA1_06090 [soil metagenome]
MDSACLELIGNPWFLRETVFLVWNEEVPLRPMMGSFVLSRSTALVLLLATLTLGVGLGRSGCLSYHEALVGQGARELLEPGSDWRAPTVGGRPWLEKPPLAHWLVAALGGIMGRVDEAVARSPSAISAALLALGVASLATRRFGPGIGLLAGLVQVSAAWVIVRGRLADADMLLACLVAWSLVAFDRVRSAGDEVEARPWRWIFFGLLGMTSMVKGIGFGAGLIASAVLVVLLWNRDGRALRRLAWPLGWVLAIGLTLAWPLAVLARYPEVLELWTVHVTDRFSPHPERFIGEPWWAFVLAPLGLVLPWTPLALLSLRSSLGRARNEPGGPDRLLWAWAVAPLVLLSLATVKNSHYLIHALPPWSIWAALGLSRLGDRLIERRGWSADRLRSCGAILFGTIGVAVALGALLLAPRWDGRGREWSWYAEVAGQLRSGEPLILLYDWDGPDPWDRLPYPTPFGPVPHDLAVRLYYLDLDLDWPILWCNGPDRLTESPPVSGSFAVIARDRDVPALRRLGRVEPVARGPVGRWDRTYTLFRIVPVGEAIASTSGPALD